MLGQEANALTATSQHGPQTSETVAATSDSLHLLQDSEDILLPPEAEVRQTLTFFIII